MRWIVDAMNVIGSRPDGWWRDRHGAMVALVTRLEAWAADGDQVTVVFERPPTPPIGSASIRIAYAPAAGADSADDEIVRLLRDDPGSGAITVVTSDATLAGRARAAGAQVYPASGFRALLEASAR
ncbi:RNA-binding protein [Mycolicibacterium cosmeticum]|uniref:RNA-binding protein containing a PIN domain protein n=1 Tax=Mycolicibacterium cosmeticum TaxID=258533 RepID=W9BL46_MYCCO|nr:NYN domain-containing protein [Mycolicibacterium cosmeticum]TLH73157.1 RNA-binding protein [Mycolicibacterium cosmeticum]CDO09015.1 putative RNA-binding protein containing a PIN domain protein [Mycolicibacterium cosmeticum]